MAQNRSSAVMQQRKEPPDSLDFFPTPPWATRALCEALQEFGPTAELEVWEPACGEGHMTRPLTEYFDRVFASDVHDYTGHFPDQDAIFDFLIDWDIPGRFAVDGPDWVITNPPFRLAEEFIRTSLRRVRRGCAMLVRTSFLEGMERHRSLFSRCPPALVLQFAERVPMVKGRLDREASTATSYCWIVWMHDRAGARPVFDWVPPCRSKLERDHDYRSASAVAAPIPLFEGLPR